LANGLPPKRTSVKDKVASMLAFAHYVISPSFFPNFRYVIQENIRTECQMIVNGERIIVFGASVTGKQTCKMVESKGCFVVAFVDSNIELQGKLFCGRPIVTPLEISELAFDRIAIGTQRVFEVKRELSKLGVNQERVFVVEEAIERGALSFPQEDLLIILWHGMAMSFVLLGLWMLIDWIK
jgi:FlaA1/EpsC-like NDP-sugar epimerase